MIPGDMQDLEAIDGALIDAIRFETVDPMLMAIPAVAEYLKVCAEAVRAELHNKRNLAIDTYEDQLNRAEADLGAA